MNYKYFSENEFICKCGCGTVHMNPLLIVILDKIRNEIGFPIKVTSGIRCLKHNQSIGSRPTSQHVPNEKGMTNAADVTSEDLDLLYQICQDHFMAVGDGRTKGFIHVDMRPDKVRRWNY